MWLRGGGGAGAGVVAVWGRVLESGLDFDGNGTVVSRRRCGGVARRAGISEFAEMTVAGGDQRVC